MQQHQQWHHHYNPTSKEWLPWHHTYLNNMATPSTSAPFTPSTYRWQSWPKHISGTGYKHNHMNKTDFCNFCAVNNDNDQTLDILLFLLYTTTMAQQCFWKWQLHQQHKWHNLICFSYLLTITMTQQSWPKKDNSNTTNETTTSVNLSLYHR